MASPRWRHCRGVCRPVLEPGDDVLGAGFDPAVHPVVVVADDPAAVVASRGGDRGDGAVSAVAMDDTTIEELHQSAAGHDDVVAVSWLALAGYDHPSPVSADDDLGVDAAAVVLADGGDRLVAHWDQGAVDEPLRIGWWQTARPARGWSDGLANGSAPAAP